MMRVLVSFLGSMLLVSTSLVGLDSGGRSPNVLFILIDDLGWNDVGFNGSTFHETPEFDRLAKEWMRFDHCYTPSPMCSPTRLSILTGKNPARHGVTQWLPGSEKAFVRHGEMPRVYCPKPQADGISDQEWTLGEAFAEAGYENGFIGKWHMGSLKATGGPPAHGYPTQQAIIEANRCSMFFPFRNGGYFPEAKEGDNFTDLLTDAAIEFINKPRESPFYLHLCHFAMHSPIASKAEWRSRFERKRRSLPDLTPDRVLDDLGHQPQKLRQDDPEYAGELATLDRNIGRLISALKAGGKYDNTIVFLTGDNGGRSSYFQKHPTSNRPLRTGKTFLFEGGLRTPLLVHWPGHTESGARSNVPVSSMDFYPTLLDMAGLPLKPEQHVDGISLVPLFSGGEISRDAFYWHFPHYQGEGSYPGSAIRRGDHKLIYSYHHDVVRLFDLANDPYESKDLASALPGVADSLRADLMNYLRNVGAYIPTARAGH